MIARILAIGDELTLGRTVDTNSSHISRFLTDRGLHVERIQVVGDGQEGIEQALASAAEGANKLFMGRTTASGHPQRGADQAA